MKLTIAERLGFAAQRIRQGAQKPVPVLRQAEFFQVLGRQVRQDLFGYLVLAEDRLILPEAQAPQPDHNVHDGVAHIMVPLKAGVQVESAWRSMYTLV